MRRAGTRRPVPYVAAMTRLIVLVAALVALMATGTAYAGASFNQTLHATTQVTVAGQTTFSGSGSLPNVGAFSFSGSEVEGCPDGLICSKSFEVVLTARNGDKLTINADWSVECISFDTGVPVSTGLCDNGLPSSIGWSTSGTGRFATYVGSGSIGWSGSAGPGSPIALSLSGSLK
jgi:hypothetical protein